MANENIKDRFNFLSNQGRNFGITAGGVSLLCPTNRECPTNIPIIFFPKHFFRTISSPPVNFSKFFLQLLLFNELCKIVCSITYFWPDKRVVEIVVELARQNYNITILVRRVSHPHPRYVLHLMGL